MTDADWLKNCRTGSGAAPESRRDVAIVALRNQRDQILMVKTRRFPKYWQPVGGGIEKTDRSPTDAAQREVHEETQLWLDTAALRRVTEVPYDFGPGTVYCFEAPLDPAAGEPRFDGDEVQDHRWVAVDEAHELEMFPATKTFVDVLQGRRGDD